MFLKKTKSRNHYYLQIVQSYREGEKVKHKVLANLGRFDDLKHNPQLINLGKRFLQLAGEDVPDIRDLQELDRFVYGHKVYLKLWDSWKLNRLLQNISKNKKIQFDFPKAAMLLTIDRLMSPQSKLKCFEKQERYLDVKKIKLHNLYRCLDILCEGKEKIEEYLFERRKNLFNYKVDIVFYDVTTFHFESVHADSLRNFGYSKAAKFNEVQVMLGMLVDSCGVPVGFDLFPGNSYEGETIVNAIDKLKSRFELGEVVIVSDKAMSSKRNFARIRSSKYDYIISMRLRSFPKSLQNRIMNDEGYRPLRWDGEGKFKYKIISDFTQEMIDQEGKRSQGKVNLICFWSEKMAERDKAQRERLIKKAREYIKKGKKLHNKRGCRRYLETKGAAEVVGLDEERIKKDERFDGYYVIESSNRKLTASQVLSEYKKLWQIENSFRVMKSTLWTRPVFHWTPDRIKGHFVLCFLALLLERTLEQRLRNNGIEASPAKIKSALNDLQMSLIELNKEKYYMKGKVKKLSGSILRALKIKQPPKVIPAQKYNL